MSRCTDRQTPQLALLAGLLKETYPQLELGSVDGFQGREKEAVIVSTVRSNSEHEVGFLGEKRRLNVAMTRPKRHLCIIGDSDTISKYVYPISRHRRVFHHRGGVEMLCGGLEDALKHILNKSVEAHARFQQGSSRTCKPHFNSPSLPYSPVSLHHAHRVLFITANA